MNAAGLRTALRQLGERIDAMSLRERGLIFVTVLAVLYFAASGLLFGPLQQQLQRLEGEVKARRDQVNALNVQVQRIVHEATRDPDKENAAKLEALRARLGSLDPQLARVTQGLVSPRDMARFMEQVLTRNRALQVIRVEALTPVPLEGQSGAAAAGREVYKHGMRIEVRGRYGDLVNYLRAMENLPWKVFWGQATLASEDYPMSRLTLTIYTLSLRQGWIGI